MTTGVRGEREVDPDLAALGAHEHLLGDRTRQAAIGADLQETTLEPTVTAPSRLDALDDVEQLRNAVATPGSKRGDSGVKSTLGEFLIPQRAVECRSQGVGTYETSEVDDRADRCHGGEPDAQRLVFSWQIQRRVDAVDGPVGMPTPRHGDVERRPQADPIELVQSGRRGPGDDGTGAAVEHERGQVTEGRTLDESATECVRTRPLEFPGADTASELEFGEPGGSSLGGSERSVLIGTQVGEMVAVLHAAHATAAADEPGEPVR